MTKGLRKEAFFSSGDANGDIVTAADTWSASSGRASMSSDTTPADWSAAPGSWSPPRRPIPSIESSIVCAMPLSWVWRSVEALIAVCAPANSAWISWSRLLSVLRCQVGRYALAERGGLRAGIRISGVGHDSGINRDVLQLVAERLFVGARAILNRDGLVDARDRGAARRDRPVSPVYHDTVLAAVPATSVVAVLNGGPPTRSGAGLAVTVAPKPSDANAAVFELVTVRARRCRHAA